MKVARAESFLLLAATALVACDRPPPTDTARPWSAADHERVPGEGDTVALPNARAPKAAETLWAERCSSCHGPSGAGVPGIGAPNFVLPGWQGTRTDDELAASIVGGRGAMPRFELPASVVAELVAKVRSFAAP